MSISSLTFTLPRLRSSAAPAVPQQPAAAAPAAAPAAPAAKKDKTDITFGQLLKGAVGTVPGAVIDGVGITASTIGHAPKAVVQAYRSIYYDNTHGPMLKTLFGALVPVAAGAGLIMAAVGSVAYGIGVGAYDAATKGVGQSVKNRVDDVKNFNKMARESLQSWKEENDRIRDQQNQPPAPPAPQPAPPQP
jgi:hypothetical protein